MSASESNNPVVFLTGASRGIGLAVARILVEKFDARVIAFNRTTTPELEGLSKASGKVDLIQGDVTNSAAVSSAISNTVATYGKLDAIILNAGSLGPIETVANSTADQWKSLFDTNLFSLITALTCAVPHLRESKGKVVFVSSGAATGGYAGWGAYSASKAAMNSLCQTLAKEEPDITAIAIRPGAVDTDMQAAIRSTGSTNMKPGDYAKFTTLHESGNLVKPEDCGHVIAALAINGEARLSGKFVNWEEEDLKGYRRQ